MMASALFRLNTLTTSDGLCENQALEEPVGPVSPSGYHALRNGVEGTLLCQHVRDAPPSLIANANDIQEFVVLTSGRMQVKTPNTRKSAWLVVRSDWMPACR